MRIGIPRSLLCYYYYYPFFKTLIEELGHEAVVSDKTNAKIISDGSKVTVSELCVPIKIHNGHVLDLIEKKVDYIFIPEFVSLKKEWYCPKFLGIGDLTKYSVEGIEDRLLTAEIRTKSDLISEPEIYKKAFKPLNVGDRELRKAIKAAKEQLLKARAMSEMGYTIPEVFDAVDKGIMLEPPKNKGELKIGLMGYVNNVYDEFVSMNAVSKLKEMGADITTFEMLPEKLTDRQKNNGKTPYWVFARKIYFAAKYLIENRLVDGMIHLTAFGCGPDSIIGKLMELMCEENNIPFMTVRIDEHTGESHIQTRLEAFTDMLKH